MSEDQASLIDQVVDNEELPFDPVSFLLVVKVGLIAIVGSTFFALSTGSIAIVSVLVAFIAALVYSQAIGGGVIVRGKQSPFQGAAAYWIPHFVFFFPGILAALEAFVTGLAPSQDLLFSFNAANSYLSFIENADQWFLNVVNFDLAPSIENWLIIPSGAVILDFLNRFTDFQRTASIFLSAAPMALIFTLLHGITALSFALFAFGFMFMLITVIAYEDTTSGEVVPLGLSTLVASVGFHRAFNIRSLDELFSYYGSLLSLEGNFLLIGLGIVLTDVLIFSFLVAGVVRRLQQNGLNDAVDAVRDFVGGIRR